ncbi:hypothetical protein KY290_033448 [Solanum tuberosum]|uniref:Uncharacterized protein n=1 Tax=Solanum tuberosum TaxID=4113 RepID=A0ABQ7U3Y9_SOLTU|nr:hypothetical protein KY285_032697 [Solanum tuberosum]KAH0740405.1 hypothetical protein KY290_033448 [Solanum tuberosum]
MSGNRVRCPSSRGNNVIDEISSDQDFYGGAQPELGYDNPYRQMIFYAAGPNFPQGLSWQYFRNIESESSHPCEPSMEEDPNPESQKLYDLLQAADAKLYPGSSLSQFAIVSRMLNIKMKNNMSHRGYNQMMQLLKEALPEDNIVLDIIIRPRS